MAKSGNKERRGNRHGTLIELEDGDKALLDKLVKRYQKMFMGKATKAAVIRHLIRYANKQPSVLLIVE